MALDLQRAMLVARSGLQTARAQPHAEFNLKAPEPARPPPRPGGPAAINVKFEPAQWQAGMPVPRGTPVWRR